MGHDIFNNTADVLALARKFDEYFGEEYPRPVDAVFCLIFSVGQTNEAAGLIAICFPGEEEPEQKEVETLLKELYCNEGGLEIRGIIPLSHYEEVLAARNRRAQKTTSEATTTEEPILTPLWQAPPPRVPDPHGANAPEQQESVNFMAQRIFHVAAGFPGKAIRLFMERGITTFADIEEAGQGEIRRIFSEDPQIAGGIDSRMARAYEMGYAGTKYWDKAYHTRQRETRGSTFAGGGGTS